MDISELTHIVHEAISNAPQWVKHDLTSKDPALKARAEDALAAMIAAVLPQFADEGF